MSKHLPPALPGSTTIVISRGAIVLSLVAIALALAMGTLAYASMRENAALRELAVSCERERLQGAGRLEQMEKLVSLAAGRPFPVQGGMGGPETRPLKEKSQ